jgi:hypothetical protein
MYFINEIQTMFYNSKLEIGFGFSLLFSLFGSCYCYNSYYKKYICLIKDIKQKTRMNEMLYNKCQDLMDKLEYERIDNIKLDSKVRRLEKDNYALCKLANRDRNRGIMIGCSVFSHKSLDLKSVGFNNIKQLSICSCECDYDCNDTDDCKCVCECNDVKRWGIGRVVCIGDDHVLVKTASCEI